jgi:hypothetical protein
MGAGLVLLETFTYTGERNAEESRDIFMPLATFELAIVVLEKSEIIFVLHHAVIMIGSMDVFILHMRNVPCGWRSLLGRLRPAPLLTEYFSAILIFYKENCISLCPTI